MLTASLLLSGHRPLRWSSHGAENDPSSLPATPDLFPQYKEILSGGLCTASAWKSWVFFFFFLLLRNLGAVDLYTGVWLGAFPKRACTHQPKARTAGSGETFLHITMPAWHSAMFVLLQLSCSVLNHLELLPTAGC